MVTLEQISTTSRRKAFFLIAIPQRVAIGMESHLVV